MECGSPVPNIPVVYATDKCDTEPIVTGPAVTGSSNNCGDVLTRTWTAKDKCGNSAVKSQKIEVKDRIAPVLNNVPADITIECGAALPNPPVVTAADQCDSFNNRSPKVDGPAISTTDGQDCGSVISRTWKAIDGCNLPTEKTQKIYVQDTTRPVLNNLPPDITLNCGDPIPGVPAVTATDTCDVNPAPKVEEFIQWSSAERCGTTATRTFRATDRCSNMQTHVQKIVIRAGTIPPIPGLLCFSATNTVIAQGKGVVSMKSLEIGDYVQTSIQRDDKFSRVLSFLHLDQEAEVDYLQIHVDTSDVPLEITPDHYLFVNDHRQTVRARDIQVGHVLGEGIVTGIHWIKHRGLYAPLTETGDIVVSGVPASCYVHLLDNVAPSIQRALSHTALAPLRIACGFDFSFCMNDANIQDGYSANLAKLIQFGFRWMDGSRFLQRLVLIVCTPVFAGMVPLEKILSNVGLVATVIIVMIVVYMMASGQQEKIQCLNRVVRHHQSSSFKTKT
jgi:hypothetical protein